MQGSSRKAACMARMHVASWRFEDAYLAAAIRIPCQIGPWQSTLAVMSWPFRVETLSREATPQGSFHLHALCTTAGTVGSAQRLSTVPLACPWPRCFCGAMSSSHTTSLFPSRQLHVLVRAGTCVSTGLNHYVPLPWRSSRFADPGNARPSHGDPFHNLRQMSRIGLPHYPFAT
jgi:hypothetical protein